MSKMDFLDPQEAEKCNKQKREQFWWTPCTFRSFHKENSEVYNQYLLCRFHFNHCSLYIYIELPLGSSRMELHFWVMEFGLLIQSGAITKNFRRVGSILAPSFIFQFWYLSYIVDRHLLPVSKYTRAIIEHYYKGKVLQCRILISDERYRCS